MTKMSRGVIRLTLCDSNVKLPPRTTTHCAHPASGAVGNSQRFANDNDGWRTVTSTDRIRPDVTDLVVTRHKEERNSWAHQKDFCC
jgi:hypothetical protein